MIQLLFEDADGIELNETKINKEDVEMQQKSFVTHKKPRRK